MTSFSIFRHKKIKKNLSKVLNTFESSMENIASANAPFSIILSNTLYFKGVKRHYYGVKGMATLMITMFYMKDLNKP